MYQSVSAYFPRIRSFLENIPIIESHEHFATFQSYKDPLDFIMDNFYLGDFYSAGGEKYTGIGDYSFFTPIPHDLPMKKRFEIFQSIYRKSNKTAYARAMQEGLRLCWDVGDISEWDNFKAFADKFGSRSASVYEEIIKKCNIKAQIVDRGDLDDYMSGRIPHASHCKFALHISNWRNIHTKEHIMKMQTYLGRVITCLDDFTAAFDQYLEKCIRFGIVCIKDLNAYRRSLAIENPSKAEAEKVFNTLVAHQRVVYSDDDVKPLEDWMFHYIVRKAASLHLPVQLHTGHMASIRNDIRKANAIQLIPVLELHSDVTFDLFHGNWPYMDEFLFLGKNYPNVYLDLCWAHTIDPIYCVELLKRAVMTVPHCKILAFGGDTSAPEWLSGYLSLAKDIVAIALSDLIDSKWITEQEACQISLDWFYNNANELFGLGFDEVRI